MTNAPQKGTCMLHLRDLLHFFPISSYTHVYEKGSAFYSGNLQAESFQEGVKQKMTSFRVTAVGVE